MKDLLLAVAIATTLILSGCSGEPSQSAIEAAIQKDIARSNEAAKQMVGKAIPPDMLAKLNSAKKLACTKETDKTYKCDVEIDMTAPLMGPVKKTAPVRLVNGSDGWVVSQ